MTRAGPLGPARSSMAQANDRAHRITIMRLLIVRFATVSE
jgi:hypothetical protein